MVDTKDNKPATTKKSQIKATTEKAKKPMASEGTAKAGVAVKSEVKQQPQKAAPLEKVQKAEVTVKPQAVTSQKGMISIKQIGSPIRRDPRQVLYLKSLGLGKLNRVRQVVDNASTRGLLEKLRHMVVVVEQ